MNPQPNTAFWLQALGTLALQGTLVLAVAGVAQTWVTSPRWRRTAWLAALAGLALVLANALTGLDRKLATALAPQPKPVPQFVVRGNLPPPSGAPLPGLGDSELRAALTADPVFPAAPLEASPAVWWPAWVWLGGTLLVGLWSALPRLWLAWAWRQRTPGQPAETARRVAELAHQLGLRRRIRVISSPRLAGPIAFGVLRPSVGLPADFWTANSQSEQDAMLAHELAHLAARDPFWLAVADTLVALLWWHPLVWWGRRQFRAASEGAADEASLVVEDGPAVLAGCLVALASRWQRRGVLGLLGMAGFRSHLGRRVERLLGLRPGAQPLRPSAWKRLLLGAGSLAALAGAVALPWWMFPAHAGSGTTLLAALGEAVTRGAPPVTDPTGAPAALGDGGTGAAPSTATAPTNPTAPARQAVLTVQVPEVPGMQPKQVRTLSMDALTRRLAKLDRFSRVKCDPVGDDQIQVTLTPRDADPAGGTSTAAPPAELWAAVKRLVEHRGQLQFRAVHPASDDLLARNDCPDGYEVLSAAAATPGLPPRRSVVAREPIPGLGSTNITESAVIRDTPDSQPRVALTFDEAGKHRFAEITRENVGRAIAVVLDGGLLMAPRVNEPILGGKCEISGRFSEAEAGELAALLQHPLPAALRLTGLVQPVKAFNPAGTTPGAAYAPNAVGQVTFNSAVPGATATLVQDARLLYELGNLDEAKVKLNAALHASPDDPAARYYLRLVGEAESVRAGQAQRLAEGTPLLRPTDPSRAVGSATSPGAAIPTPASNATPDNALFTRTFRVNPNLLIEGLTNLGAAAGIPTNLPPQESLRRLMSAAGLDFAATNAPAISPASSDPTAAPGRSGKALFFNDRTGILLVRATLAELDTVEQLLQVLNSTPPQVTIEAKFVEVTMEDSQALGFDWYLGGMSFGTNQTVGPGGTATATNQGVWPGASGSGTSYAMSPEFIAYFGERGVEEVNRAAATLTGVMSDPQFKAVTRTLQQAGTNGVRQLTGDQLDWPGRQATNVSNIRVTAALGGTLSGILTDPQLRVVLRALEQRSGVDVLSAPRVTTLSGRQAQIQVVDIQSIVTGLNPDALNAPGASRTTNASPFTTAAIPAGPTLDIIPYVAADGYTIQLTVIPTVTEFLGYDEPPKDAKVRIWEGGKSRLVDPPLPRFRVRQMVTQAVVWDGQTLVLGGLVTEEPEKDRNGKPRKDGKSLRKQLLVFVTPTIVDPAGNRVHSAENLPYDPNRVPPQPRP